MGADLIGEHCVQTVCRLFLRTVGEHCFAFRRPIDRPVQNIMSCGCNLRLLYVSVKCEVATKK
jgi:hypothetical protein